MAFAASGASQCGGGQYKAGNHHAQSNKSSKVAFMSKMSDSQLLSYSDSLQDIKEEHESFTQNKPSNGLGIKQFVKLFKRENLENDDAVFIKESDQRNTRWNQCFHFLN